MKESICDLVNQFMDKTFTNDRDQCKQDNKTYFVSIHIFIIFIALPFWHTSMQYKITSISVPSNGIKKLMALIKVDICEYQEIKIPQYNPD